MDVVDASGRGAAGISLAWGLVSSSRPGSFEEQRRTRSDARGSAWIELSALPNPTSLDESLRLRAEILAHPLPELALDPSVLEEQHVVLRLPPTGSVRLEVADALGRTPLPAVHFAVWARPTGAARDVEPLPRWVAAPDGVALLENVGLGLELRVAVALDGDEARAERITASGPRFAGEECALSVPLGAEWPTVLVRALDEHHEVLRNALLGAAVKWSRPGTNPTWNSDRWNSEASPPRSVRTDDEGRVRFPLRGTVAGGFTRRLVLTQPGGSEGAGVVLRSAERDLSWDAAAGSEIDLGDVELRPLEPGADAVVWVSGRVADLAGNPVPAATVLVSALDAEGAPLRGPAAQATVEPDGRFVVTGPPLEERLSVRAVAPGFLGTTADVVVPGASGVHVCMQSAARWAGRLRLDTDIPPESLVVEVLNADRRARTIPASERIAVDGLEAGSVDVEVRTRTGNWLIERWDRLPTHSAGSEAHEDELDLRGRLTHLRLHLTEPDGTELERVFAHVVPAPWPEGSAWIRAGRLELIVPREAREILIRPEGYPPLSAEPIGAPQELGCGPRIEGGARAAPAAAFGS